MNFFIQTKVSKPAGNKYFAAVFEVGDLLKNGLKNRKLLPINPGHYIFVSGLGGFINKGAFNRLFL